MIEQPAWGAAGIAAITWLVLMARRSRRHAAVVATVRLVESVPSTWRTRLRWMPEVCRCAALLSAIVAVAGPSCVTSDVAESQLDVLFLLDTSLSMRGMDVQPDRFRRAQQIIEQAIALRSRDRVGLILFAGTHTLACPLTHDHAAFLDRLQSTSPVDGEGTAMGAATLGTLTMLRRARSPSSVIVLLTDGVSTVDDVGSVEAADRALAALVPIIVVQTGAGGPVPMPTEFGAITVDLDDPVNALQPLALRTGGRVINARQQDAGPALASALGALTPSHSTSIQVATDVTSAWAGIALAFLAVQVSSSRVLRMHIP